MPDSNDRQCSTQKSVQSLPSSFWWYLTWSNHLMPLLGLLGYAHAWRYYRARPLSCIDCWNSAERVPMSKYGWSYQMIFIYDDGDHVLSSQSPATIFQKPINSFQIRRNCVPCVFLHQVELKFLAIHLCNSHLKQINEKFFLCGFLLIF